LETPAASPSTVPEQKRGWREAPRVFSSIFCVRRPTRTARVPDGIAVLWRVQA
jgi:hypothetical protein